MKKINEALVIICGLLIGVSSANASLNYICETVDFEPGPEEEYQKPTGTVDAKRCINNPNSVNSNDGYTTFSRYSDPRNKEQIIFVAGCFKVNPHIFSYPTNITASECDTEEYNSK